MKKRERGFVLPAIIMSVLLIAVVLTILLMRGGQEIKSTVNAQQSVNAYNLAQGGVERALWKIQTSTVAYAKVFRGEPVDGYNFDVQQEGALGAYRVRIATGPGTNQITIHSEGRDAKTKQVRGVETVYERGSLPGPLVYDGNGQLKISSHVWVHWGPIVSKADINMTTSSLYAALFPHKMARLVAKPWDASVDEPSSDAAAPHWWSNLSAMTIPSIDFDALKEQARAFHTLNCYGTYSVPLGRWRWPSGAVYYGQIPCEDTDPSYTVASLGMQNNVDRIVLDRRHDDDLVWFWENNQSGLVQFRMPGLIGKMVVLNHIKLMTGDALTSGEVGPLGVPKGAHSQYNMVDVDSNVNYPADAGQGASAATYNLVPHAANSIEGGSGAGQELGLKGFMYAQGNVDFYPEPSGTILDYDIYGAIWTTGGSIITACTGPGCTTTWRDSEVRIFFDENLKVPTKDRAFRNIRWDEVPPSGIPW